MVMQDDTRIARCILCGCWVHMPAKLIRNAAYMPICSTCLQAQLDMLETLQKVHQLSVNTL